MKALLLSTVLTVSLTAAAQAQFPGFKRKTKEAVPAPAAPATPATPPAVQPQPDVRPGRTRPAPQPQMTPAPRPAPLPGSSGGLPSQGGHGSRSSWPGGTARPYPNPNPAERPATNPYPSAQPGVPPVTRPAPQNPKDKPRPQPVPGQPLPQPVPTPGTRPAPLPDNDDFLDIRPGPQPLPAPGYPAYRTKPATPKDRPVTKPVAPGINLPPQVLPIRRPPRPVPPPQVNNTWVNHTNVWNNWTVQNNVTINNFVVQRPAYWAPIQNYSHATECWQNYGRPDWQDWRRTYWEYRAHRCQEVWNVSYQVSGQLFDVHWWSHCSWAGRPVPQDVPPWWWWQPVTWEAILQHVAIPAKARQPRNHDPGVNIILQNGRVYIDGVDSWPDWKYVQNTRAFAAIDWPWEPPYAGGRYQWLPLGVWALSPVEQGEATMYFQLSVSREGFISGAFTNTLTGEDLPIKGATSLTDQRVAFFIGSRPDTVVETGLAQFTNDITGAFLHHANGESSNWLLTRIPGPGSAPGPVRVPAFR